MKSANGQQMQVRVYEDLDALCELLPAWEDLLAHYAPGSIFSTWEWLAPWWRAFGGDQRLLVLAFFDENQQLAALAPLSLSIRRAAGMKFRVLRLVGDGSDDSENLDLPVRPGNENAFVNGLLSWLETQRASWDFAELRTIPSNSPAAKQLFQQLQQRGWKAVTRHAPWSVVTLPESWESYLRQISAKEKGKLNYYLRRIEKKYSAVYEKCAEEGELPARLDELYQLHHKRWQLLGQEGSFAAPARRKFYSEMSRLLLSRNQLEFWRLTLDGKAVAAQFGFRYGDTVYQLQEGFDPAYSTDSVGYALRGYVVKQLIAEGVRRYDFLGGESSSKSRWGAETDYYADIQFARPFTRGSFYLKLLQAAEQGKEQARARLPRRALFLLHEAHLRLRGKPRGPAQDSRSE